MIVALSKLVLRAASIGRHVTERTIGSPWDGFCGAFRALTGEQQNPLEGASFPPRGGSDKNDHHRQAAMRAMNR